ncbi:HAD family hydrolase [Sphingomonas sp. PB1R3]|uniref:HAD family hydrolase n=1 Tax=Sphingomonas flavida TaxID=3096154 RepID=UPI002FC68FA7
MTIELICLDADDTLWHNMRHFAETEEALVGLLAPFAEARVARATLEACEARNLRLYGYGAKGFTLSMIETAVELAGPTLSTELVARLLEAGRQLLAHPVALLDGIAETIDALETRGRLVLVTKGDLLHQEAKLAASGLGSRFDDVAIVSDKTPDTFRRIFARHGVAPERAVMAGDSMRSDVLPALQAGAWAAYIPQPLAWSHEAGDHPVDHPRFRQLERLGDLPGWIDAIGR